VEENYDKQFSLKDSPSYNKSQTQVQRRSSDKKGREEERIYRGDEEEQQVEHINADNVDYDNQ
jgi:hypothetical protein